MLCYSVTFGRNGLNTNTQKIYKLILHILSHIGLTSVHIYMPSHCDGPEIRLVTDGFEMRTES